MSCCCRLLRPIFRVKPVYKRSAIICCNANVRLQLYSTENLKPATFELNLSDVVKDLRHCEKIWKKRMNTKHLEFLFEKRLPTNSLTPSYVVSLLNASCYERLSAEFIFTLLMSLSKCVQDNKSEFIPSSEEKIEAVRCALKYNHYQLLQFVCALFNVVPDLQFKKFVDELIKDQKLVEASQCISVLNLHREYNLEEIILPVLLNGNIQSAIICLMNDPDSQVSVAKKLDSYLVIDKREYATSRFPASSKKVYKILSSLVNILKLPPDLCKNLHYIRGRSAINLLIKKRISQSVLEETWEDMVMSVVEQNPLLKDHLIYKLVSLNEKEAALKMKTKLNMQDVDIEKLSETIAIHSKEEDAIEDSENLTEDVENDIEADNPELRDKSVHLKFGLTAADIKFITTKSAFEDCIKDITENYDLLGFDSEWKPHFGLGQDRLSLVQLAVRDKVYILDLLSLADCLSTDHWDKLMDNVFGNSKIIKLGCGIMADVQMIVESNRGTKGKAIRFSHVLDIAVFYQKLQQVYPEKMDSDPENSKNQIGLSKLCDTILGKPLNKEERLCDWEKRPLTESQLEYAALDAHCLIQLYDKLREEAAEKNINFDHQVQIGIVLTNSLWKAKRRMKKVTKDIEFQIHKPLPIQQFKVIIDPTIDHLGKQLRQLGADVLTMKSSDTLDHIAEVSKQEGRILLCAKSLWSPIQHKIPAGFCFKCEDSFGDCLSVSHILQKFNIQLRSKAILSPCTVCNADECVSLSPEDINLLLEIGKDKAQTNQALSTKTSKLQSILDNFHKLGIHIKFYKDSDSLADKKCDRFLCTKCGTLQ